MSVQLLTPLTAKRRRDSVPCLMPVVRDPNPAAYRLLEQIKDAPMWRLVRVARPVWVEICGLALYLPAQRDVRIPLRFWQQLAESEEGTQRALEGVIEGAIGVRRGASLCLNCKRTREKCECPALT